MRASVCWIINRIQGRTCCIYAIIMHQMVYLMNCWPAWRILLKLSQFTLSLSLLWSKFNQAIDFISFDTWKSSFNSITHEHRSFNAPWCLCIWCDLLKSNSRHLFTFDRHVIVFIYLQNSKLKLLTLVYHFKFQWIFFVFS